MIELEQPKYIGEILGDALEIYRAYLWVFLAIALLATVPLEVATAVWDPNLHIYFGPLVDEAPLAVSGVLTFGVIVPLTTAATAFATIDAAEGRRPTLRAAFGRARGVFVAVAIAFVLQCVGVALGLVLLVVPGIWAAVVLFFAAEAAAIEGLGPVAALQRSMALVRGRWWSTLGITLMLCVAGLLLVTVIALPFHMLGAAVGSKAVIVAGTILSDAVSCSFGAVTGTLLFFSWRATEPIAEVTGAG